MQNWGLHCYIFIDQLDEQESSPPRSRYQPEFSYSAIRDYSPPRNRYQDYSAGSRYSTFGDYSGARGCQSIGAFRDYSAVSGHGGFRNYSAVSGYRAFKDYSGGSGSGALRDYSARSRYRPTDNHSSDDCSPPKSRYHDHSSDDCSPPRSRYHDHSSDDYSLPRSRYRPTDNYSSDDCSPPRSRYHDHSSDDDSPPRSRPRSRYRPTDNHSSDDYSPPRSRYQPENSPNAIRAQFPRRSKSRPEVSPNPIISPRSGYQPEISPDAIKAIILEVMKEYGVKLKDIRKVRHLRFEMKGFAWFACPKRDNYWPSAHAWCILDLKTQTLCDRYKQGCKKCESKASPEFTPDSIRRMAKRAVKLFLIRTGKLASDPPNTDTDESQGGAPHDEDRCSKCQKLGHSCWKRIGRAR